MKAIVIKTTEANRLKVLKKYSNSNIDLDKEVEVEITIPQETSDIYKELTKDSDIIDWKFKEDRTPKSAVIEEYKGSANTSEYITDPKILDKLKEIDLIDETDKINEKISDEEFSRHIDLRDMNQIIWWCTNVLKKNLESIDTPTGFSSYKTVIRDSLLVEIPKNSGVWNGSNIWNGLSEGLVKMILVLMSHGTKEFAKILNKGSKKVRDYYKEHKNATLTNEEFLHKIFVE